MLKQGLIVGVAGIVAIVLAVGGSSEPFEAAEASVAACGRSSSPATVATWRGSSPAAGALRLPAQPLAKMVEVEAGQFAARMPVLVGGRDYIVLSVPLALRDRVFLYYGRVADRAGQPLSSLRGAAGYAEVEFQPCRDRPRSVWPGAIRVIGRAPVRLLATIEGQPRSVPLALGSPSSKRQAQGSAP
ncbi:MAG TPA: hypothetical protein VHS74_18805 [Solirubrobacterales bacterium]|nr:hypothetical protein [Solirubrobacterales bacterium]